MPIFIFHNSKVLAILGSYIAIAFIPYLQTLSYTFEKVRHTLHVMFLHRNRNCLRASFRIV